jgi:outer membrane receptor for ferrienterochelin and colicins
MSGRYFLRSASRAALLASVAAACTIGAAQAQTMDYGALEKTFGEAVTTSATGQPQRATEVPAEMDIVSATDIRRSGAVDLPGVLKQVPGVDVLQWGTDDADISVRGYDQAYSSRLLVLVDGRQVYADHYGYTPWTAIPVELSAIRQIEVVKGPNTALFGANAVSGVINIITYNPLYDDINSVSVTGGTQGTIRGSAVTTFQDSGVWALRLSGSAGLDNDFSSPIPDYYGGFARTQNTRGAIDADGIVQLNAHTQIGLELSHSQTQSNDVDPAYEMAHERHITNSVKGQLNADTDFGLVQFMGYTNWIALDTNDELGAPFDFDDQSTVLQLQDVLRLGNDNVVRGALEFRHNEVATTPDRIGRVFYDLPSFSGMWNWTISPDLSLTNAVRFDSLAMGRSGTVPPGYPFTNSDWNRNISQWSFNSGLVWKASQDDTLRLQVSRGIQLPNLAFLGAYFISTPLYNASGSPNVDAAASMNYELDWDRELGVLNASLRTALFYQQTVDLFGLEGAFLPGPPPYVTTGNIGDSNAAGGEAGLTGPLLEHWHWGASYRLETVKDKFLPFAQGGLAFADFQHTTPKHQIKGNLGWARGAWEADGFLYYQSATQGLFPTATGTAPLSISPYVNADARIGYRINNTLTLSVSGQNLLQDRQRQTSGPEIERRIFLNLLAGF